VIFPASLACTALLISAPYLMFAQQAFDAAQADAVLLGQLVVWSPGLTSCDQARHRVATQPILQRPHAANAITRANAECFGCLMLPFLDAVDCARQIVSEVRAVRISGKEVHRSEPV
jgi:hypothetical protein